jgi:short-subunit dehydrogenase
MGWTDSVAVVTGGSKGIGKAIAATLVARGARVGIVARDRDELDRALHEIGGQDAGAVAVADLADRAQVEKALDELQDALGPPDVLVNNAGVGSYGTVADVSADTFGHLVAVNYLSAVYATKAVLPGMLERGRGHIVSVASVAGRFAPPYESAYAATKFALVGFSMSLALEIAHSGVGVSIVTPGPVATEFFERRGVPYQRRWPRMLKPESVAGAVIHAVERNRLEVTVPRWYRSVGVLQAAFPGLMRLVPRTMFRPVPVSEARS